MDTNRSFLSSAVSPSSSTQHRALLVDSGPGINKLLGNIFQGEGWNVELAASNKDALQLAKTHPFDLIITGAHTSGKEDVELLRRLRMVRPHTRLIILADEFAPGDIRGYPRACFQLFLPTVFHRKTLGDDPRGDDRAVLG